MSPLQPICFSTPDFQGKQWRLGNGGLEAICALRQLTTSFPSILLAFSSSPGAKPFARQVALDIIEMGINVFVGRGPVPLAALSLALIQRQMPLGFYLHEEIDNHWQLLPVGIHGGPIDADQPLPFETHSTIKTGVLGETDILKSYVAQLDGLFDPFIEAGLRFSSISSPFKEVQELLSENPNFAILNERSDRGPRVEISGDGQALEVFTLNNVKLPTLEIVSAIGRYLIQIRRSNGVIIGPRDDLKEMKKWAECKGIDGTALDMSNNAVSADLLLGWWEPGIIAHQGHSPFGDAFLSMAYLIEAWCAGIK